MFLLLSLMLGLVAAISCPLVFDSSRPMQQQLQDMNLVVPFDVNPPFSVSGGGGSITEGFSYDILIEIANRGNFSVVMTTDGEAVNETNDQLLARLVATSEFFGSYWSDTPERRAKGAMFSVPYVDVTRVLVTGPPVVKPAAVTDGMFTFLTPFSAPLWIVIVFGVIVSGLVSYWFEMSSLCGRKHVLAEALEENNKRWKIYWGFLYRSFSHFAAAGDSLEAKSVVGQVHNIVWAFVVLVLLSAYTANLASTILVKKTIYEDYSTVDLIYKQNKAICVSPDDDVAIQFLRKNRPGIQLFPPSCVSPCTLSDQDVANALLKGSCVGAVMTRSGFDILSTDVTYCSLNEQQQVGSILGGGFGFSIDNCGYFKMAVVNSILTDMRADGTIDNLWQKEIKEVPCPASSVQTVVASAQGLGLDSFSGLFILYCCWIGCTVFLRVFRKSFSGIYRLIKKCRRRFCPSQRAEGEEEEQPEPSTIKDDESEYSEAPISTSHASSTTPVAAAGGGGNAKKFDFESASDFDTLNLKVTCVEHTLEHLMVALRELHQQSGETFVITGDYIAASSPSAAHRRVESKQGDHRKAESIDLNTHKRTGSKQSDHVRNGSKGGEHSRNNSRSRSRSRSRNNSKDKGDPTHKRVASKQAHTLDAPLTSGSVGKRLSGGPATLTQPVKRLSASGSPEAAAARRLSANVPNDAKQSPDSEVKRLSTNIPAAEPAKSTTVVVVPTTEKPTPAESTLEQPVRKTGKSVALSPLEVGNSDHTQPSKHSPVGLLNQAVFAPFGQASPRLLEQISSGSLVVDSAADLVPDQSTSPSTNKSDAATSSQPAVASNQPAALTSAQSDTSVSTQPVVSTQSDAMSSSQPTEPVRRPSSQPDAVPSNQSVAPSQPDAVPSSQPTEPDAVRRPSSQPDTVPSNQSVAPSQPDAVPSSQPTMSPAEPDAVRSSQPTQISAAAAAEQPDAAASSQLDVAPKPAQ